MKVAERATNPFEDAAGSTDGDFEKESSLSPTRDGFDQANRPNPGNSQSGMQDPGGNGEAIPKPAEAFWANLSAPFNNTSSSRRAINLFEYGEALGRTIGGWRAKVLSRLFTPTNATKIEIATTRGVIKGLGKGLVVIAPLSAIVDLADVFRRNRMGTSNFYQNYGLTGLGAIGGIVGGAAFDVFGIGILATFGLSGVGAFVVAPLVFSLIGAGSFQWAGSTVDQLTQPGSFLYNWYPGSFLDRYVSSVCSWILSLAGGSVNVAQPGRQTSSKKQGSRRSFTAPKSAPPDSDSSRRRLESRFDPFLSPWRGGPGAPVTGDGGDDGGPDGGEGGGPIGGPTGEGIPVGGVLFENCHTVLTGIEELTGACWDESTKSIVLIGKDCNNRKRQRLALPAMDVDHLKVALRAAILGESLGVSIDAPAEYRHGENGNRLPPSGTPFFVSYLGGSDRTLAGAIFFEADRIMKCLSLGMHNETRKAFEAHVPGFRSTFDLHGRTDGLVGTSWHRFWFVVDHVELKRTRGTEALAFGEVRIAVKTELEVCGASPGQFADPLDAEFAQHLTSHYDEHAEEFPVFARLKELAKISALASFLINQNVDLDFGEILDTLPIEVSTPETTPSLIRSESSRSGNAVYAHMMSGGVDLGITACLREDVDGVAIRMGQSALASRSESASEWSFRVGKSSLCANAVRLGFARRFRLIETDHEFSTIGGLPRLSFQRIYVSKAEGDGMFGKGWTLFVPWSLTVLRGSGKRREVLDPRNAATRGPRPVLALRHCKSGNVQIYRPLAEPQASGRMTWGRVTSRNTHANSVSFEYDPTDLICEQDGRLVMEHTGRQFCFDQSGRLLEIRCDARTLARYVWAENRLERLDNDAGQGYRFIYSKETRAIKTVQTSDGHELRYSYGSGTCLREVCIGSQPHSLYGYDLMERLNEVSDATGTITQRVRYDSMGDLVSGGAPDTVDLPDGHKINRMFVGDRLTALSDENGTRAEFTYGPMGRLHSVFVRNRGGLNWRLEYGVNGKLRRIFDGLSRVTEFESNQQGQVARITFPDKTAVTAERDDQGRITQITPLKGKGWKATYDLVGLLTSVGGPAKQRIEIRPKEGDRFSMKVLGEDPKSSLAIGPFPYRFNLRGQPQFDSDVDQQMARPIVGRYGMKCTIGPDGKWCATEGPAGTVKIGAAEIDSNTEIVEFR